MGTLSVSSVRRKPCLSMDAKNTKLMNHLVEIRKNLVTDRVKENQDKAYVEEKGLKLLTIRKWEPQRGGKYSRSCNGN